MLSFLRKIDGRRATYLNLVGSIESQLRDVYACLHEAGLESQTSLARKLGVGRSVVNRRLTGQQNMTLESLADMVWALGASITVKIDDPATQSAKNFNVSGSARIAQPADIASPTPMDIKRAPTSVNSNAKAIIDWADTVAL
jgi:transcriptional regulator with XRE-family HTH domain